MGETGEVLFDICSYLPLLLGEEREWVLLGLL